MTVRNVTNVPVPQRKKIRRDVAGGQVKPNNASQGQKKKPAITRAALGPRVPWNPGL